jgi:SHS2 domain-containing protein
MNIKMIEHTADTGFQVYGKTLEELFKNSAKGMMKIILGNEGYGGVRGPDETRNILVEGNEKEDLLFSFLSEVLYLFDGENFIATNFSDISFSDGTFTTKANGKIFDPENLRAETEIKAVTYHKMKIEYKDNFWTTSVIFDI